MYNLIEYSDNYLKTSRSLWQYHYNKTLKYNIKIKGKTPAIDKKMLR